MRLNRPWPIALNTSGWVIASAWPPRWNAASAASMEPEESASNTSSRSTSWAAAGDVPNNKAQTNAIGRIRESIDQLPYILSRVVVMVARGGVFHAIPLPFRNTACLLYTSDAADEE